METENIKQIEQALAVEAAWLDIEYYCVPHGLNETDREIWFNSLGVPIEDRDRVRRAVNYLDAKKLITRHPEKPGLVRIVEPVTEGSEDD